MSYLREKLLKLLTVSCWDIGPSCGSFQLLFAAKNYIESSIN